MMRMLRQLPLVMLAMLALASCDKEEDIDRSYTDYRYDIVTYLGKNETGAVFEYLGHGDSAALKLQSRVSVSEVKSNQRVLLRYDFADKAATADGMRHIDVFACNGIVSDSLRKTQSPDSLPRHQVKLRSLWRTGEFINVHCQVEFTNNPRTFMLVADGKTLDSDTVKCYLTHDLRGERGTFWRDCYGSFNVGVLWKRTTFKCLRIYLNDVTFPNTEYYDFNK